MAQFVKKPELICEALGLQPTRAGKQRLAEYRSWKDFPKMTKAGIALEELDQFLVRNAPRISAMNALEDLKKGKALSGATLKLIETHRTGNFVSPPAPQAGLNFEGNSRVEPGSTMPLALLPDANTQHQVAENLQRFYRARLRRDVTDVDVSNWLKNKDLPDGAPMPPPKVNQVFKGVEWAAWFERWILPHWMGDPQSQSDLFNLSALERQNKIESLQHDKFLRDLDRNKYIEKTAARSTALGALKIQDAIVRRHNEVVFARKLGDWLAARGVAPETMALVNEGALESGRAVQDEIGAHYQKTVKELTEQDGEVERENSPK